MRRDWNACNDFRKLSAGFLNDHFSYLKYHNVTSKWNKQISHIGSDCLETRRKIDIDFISRYIISCKFEVTYSRENRS